MISCCMLLVVFGLGWDVMFFCMVIVLVLFSVGGSVMFCKVILLLFWL